MTPALESFLTISWLIRALVAPIVTALTALHLWRVRTMPVVFMFLGFLIMVVSELAVFALFFFPRMPEMPGLNESLSVWSFIQFGVFPIGTVIAAMGYGLFVRDVYAKR